MSFFCSEMQRRLDAMALAACHSQRAAFIAIRSNHVCIAALVILLRCVAQVWLLHFVIHFFSLLLQQGVRVRVNTYARLLCPVHGIDAPITFCFFCWLWFEGTKQVLYCDHGHEPNWFVPGVGWITNTQTTWCNVITVLC